jgi:hypothetical protein
MKSALNASTIFSFFAEENEERYMIEPGSMEDPLVRELKIVRIVKRLLDI